MATEHTRTTSRVETKLKGVNFRSFMKAFRVLRGEEAVERMLADLPSEVSRALRYGGIVAGGWYPVAWYRLMHASAQHVTNSGQELVRAIGLEACGAEAVRVAIIAGGKDGDDEITFEMRWV
ncbi:MAG: hypothetical protein ABI332_05545 [Polyangiaceae bacterium]